MESFRLDVHQCDETKKLKSEVFTPKSTRGGGWLVVSIKNEYFQTLLAISVKSEQQDSFRFLADSACGDELILGMIHSSYTVSGDHT